MKQIDPKSLTILRTLPPLAKKGDMISVDTEFAQMDSKRLHRPHGKFSGMGCSFDGQTVYIITDETDIEEFMALIKDGTHIYHNAKFDVGQIRRYCSYPDRKLIWDTMLMEQIMFAGWYSAGEFSLADLSRRYLDCYMDKSVREQFETSDGEMTKEQIEYLAVDVVTTWRVYQEQRKIADENDLNVWKNIDRGAMYSVLRLHGMKLDVDAWMKLYEFNLAEAQRIQDKYGKEEIVVNKRGTEKSVFTGINLASPAQVKNALLDLGYKLDGTDEKSLTPILEECEFAKDVLEFRGCAKAAKTYGKNFVEEHVEADGRIYSDFYINGAATGRFCVSADTLLETTQGTFRICDLPLTGNSSCAILTHKNRYKNILQKINKGKEEMFLVTLDNGNQIKCTANHRFLTNHGWKKLKDITDDDTICEP